jgi:hypothetical protein
MRGRRGCRCSAARPQPATPRYLRVRVSEVPLRTNFAALLLLSSIPTVAQVANYQFSKRSSAPGFISIYAIKAVTIRTKRDDIHAVGRISYLGTPFQHVT